MEDRSVGIEINGQSYSLLLTTDATAKIAGRFGGLENVESRLREDYEQALGDVCWLIALLANQTIIRHNLMCPDDKKQLITDAYVSVFTSPFEVAEFKDALAECFVRGMKRNIISADDESKNGMSG
ncbi:hypothetical protein FACS1894202_07730 [Clostridia bacterium]|nr:hypothetical protein FACS1894202_07730 [Clostridia bacterium]